MSQNKDQATLSIDFQSDLDTILGADLSPEVIDTYVDTAINGVASVVVRAREAYAQVIDDVPKTAKELEDEALEYYGIRNVESILGSLSVRSEEIRKLTVLLDSLPISDEVITPTDPRPLELANVVGGNSFVEKPVIYRLKTLAFLVHNTFGVNALDGDEFSVLRGATNPSGLRQLGYDFVEIPGMDRIVLSCDEAENVSYVFVASALASYGVSPEELRAMTKPQLNELLDGVPGLGQRVMYSQSYTARMTRALVEPGTVKSAQTPNCDAPHAPKEVENVNNIVDGLGIHQKTVDKAILALGDELGEVGRYKFGKSKKSAAGYDEQQRWKILEELDKMGVFAPRPPEGTESQREIALGLDIDYGTVGRAIAKLKDELGEVESYRFGYSKVSSGYNEQQRWKILGELDRRSLFAPVAPEGFISEVQLAKLLHRDVSTIRRAAKALGDELGSVSVYKFGTRPSTGYSSHQQSALRAYLDT